MICILHHGIIVIQSVVTQQASARTCCSAVEQAQRQVQEAEGAQQHAAEEEAKAARLAQQAEQRAKQEQGKGNLPAAVAASSTAARYADNLLCNLCTEKEV